MTRDGLFIPDEYQHKSQETRITSLKHPPLGLQDSLHDRRLMECRSRLSQPMKTSSSTHGQALHHPSPDHGWGNREVDTGEQYLSLPVQAGQKGVDFTRRSPRREDELKKGKASTNTRPHRPAMRQDSDSHRPRAWIRDPVKELEQRI